MIRLFEDQDLGRSLREGDICRKKDLAVLEQVQRNEKRENTMKIPFQDNSIRNDLQRTLEKYNTKNSRDSFRIFEENLARKIGDDTSRYNREQKLRQLLWETSPELIELRKQMLMAEVTRDQALQVAEKQAMSELRRQEEESLAAALEGEKKEYEEEQRRLEQLEFQAKLRYHKELDDLREFKVSKEDRSEELQRREREAIDEIKRKIEEEDRETARKKLESQKEYQRQANELQKVREGMRQLEKQKDKTLETKADEYRKAQELRTRRLEEEKQLDLLQRLQLQEELLSDLEKMYAEKARRDLIRTELGIEEREVLEKDREEEAEKRRKILREELQRLYDMQMYVKQQKEELEKKEEALFREKLLNQLYEEAKLEQMSQQKRRLKQAEHRRTVQQLIDENRKKKEIEEAREKANNEHLKQQEAERLRLVEEERRKFLSMHAKELLGYLPKKVFRDKQEIERLGEDFKKFYSRENCSGDQ